MRAYIPPCARTITTGSVVQVLRPIIFLPSVSCVRTLTVARASARRGLNGNGRWCRPRKLIGKSLCLFAHSANSDSSFRSHPTATWPVHRALSSRCKASTYRLLLCAAKDETSVDIMRRMFFVISCGKVDYDKSG
jgi:hypothetical protein